MKSKDKNNMLVDKNKQTRQFSEELPDDSERDKSKKRQSSRNCGGL